MYRNLNQENMVCHGTIPLILSTVVFRIVCMRQYFVTVCSSARTLYLQLPGLWMCVW